MKDTVTARKYAKALFAQAQVKNEVLACQQGLEEITRIIRVRESLRGILMQPFISPGEKEKLIHASLGEYATPLLERFFTLLIHRRRFDLLPSIALEFQQEVDQSQNIQALQVRVAYPMSDSQQKTLQQKLEGWMHSKLRMNVTVDPAIIGGVIVRTRDQEMDQSLRTKLKRLKEAMIG